MVTYFLKVLFVGLFRDFKRNIKAKAAFLQNFNASDSLLVQMKALQNSVPLFSRN